MDNQRFFAVLLLILPLLALVSCSTNVQTEAKYPTGYERAQTGGDIYAKPESIFGKGGLFGKRDRVEDGAGGTGIAVNSFLWRASLDTVAFMPLANADPFGGTIFTDWYMPDPQGSERFKINVLILSRQLRSDAVSVRVFKQEMSKGVWKDAPVTDSTGRQLEDAILTRARQLRMAQMGTEE